MSSLAGRGGRSVVDSMRGMDATQLARVQFAVTTSFHFLFVTLTLGLALLVAMMETRYVRTGDDGYARMTRFWGQIYVVNYAMGIVTGIVMEFQFGLNWNGLTQAAGNVFGAPLAMETLVAFFAESTFLGMWIFGWERLPKRVHLALIWLVTLTAFLSAYWVLVANGFLQHPVGYVMRGGQAHVTDMGALMTNPFALSALGHIAAGALITAGLFIAGISAYHLRKRTADEEFFRRSLRTGVITAAAGLLPSIALGLAQFQLIDKYQPTKQAALSGSAAKVAKAQADMAAVYGPGDYRAPTGAVQGGSNAMMFIWFGVTVLLIAALVMFRGGALYRVRWFQRLLIFAIPLPFVANIGGWLFREMGRQPFAVYGLIRTDQAASHVSATWVAVSLAGFMALFLVLAAADYLVIARIARRGPAQPGVAAAAVPELAVTF